MDEPPRYEINTLSEGMLGQPYNGKSRYVLKENGSAEAVWIVLRKYGLELDSNQLTYCANMVYLSSMPTVIIYETMKLRNYSAEYTSETRICMANGELFSCNRQLNCKR